MSDKAKGLFFISVTIFCWGILAIIIKSISHEVSSYHIAWFRFFFAASGLIIFQGIKNPSYLKIFKKPPIAAIIAGLCLGGNYLGFNKGVELTSPAITQIIIQLGPLTLALIGLFIFKEKINLYQIIGFMLASLGFLLFYKDQLTQFLNSQLLDLGVLWVVFGAWTWTAYAVCQKKLVTRFPPSQLNLLIFTVPALALAPTVNFTDFMSINLSQLITLMILGANTLIAYGCLGEAFRYLPANNISILITLNPLITLLGVELIYRLGLNWIPYSPIGYSGYLGVAAVIIGASLIVGMQRKTKIKR